MTSPGQLAPPPLKIQIIGPPVVSKRGQVIKIDRRENRALLFYLAGRIEPVSRAELCDLFWPKDNEITAHKKLREALSRLRTSLQEPDLILSDNGSVGLSPINVENDWKKFSGLILPIISGSEMNSNDPLPDWCYDQLRKAIDLCRGNQFLQGIKMPASIGFENWVGIIDHTYSLMREKIVQRLIDHSIAIGNITEALVWLQMAVNIDPFNLDNNFLMLNCLKERGRIREAFSFLDYLEREYRSSMYEELPEILNNFKERILEKPPHVAKTKESFQWPGGDPGTVPFVGRDDLLKRLENAYHRKGIVYITGEPGSGKSRLAQEFFNRLDFKPRLLFCVGKPMVRSSPFAPLVEGLRSIVSRQEWKELPDFVSEPLGDLFTELKGDDRKFDLHEENPLARQPLLTIFDALLFLLINLSKSRPLLMVVDIADLCDDATIKFLTYLNERNFFKQHGLLVLLSRDDGHNEAFDAYINRSVLANGLEKIYLPPFSLQEIVHLTSVMVGKPISDELINKIRSETGGNPFFLIETIKAFNLIEFDTATYSQADFYPVPATIQAMVNEEVQALSKLARKVLESASVLGKTIMPKVLELMVDLDSADFISALEELQHKSILIGESGLKVDAQYIFPLGQIREVVIDGMSPARKRRLHLDAIKALQEVKGNAPDQATIFAYHYEQAGEPQKAFESWCMAGRFARSRFSVEDTYAAYQRASDLLSDMPLDESKFLVSRLMVEWGDFAYDLDDATTCKQIYNRGFEFGDVSQDSLLIGMALSGWGRVAEMTDEIEEGIELLKRSLFFLGRAEAMGELLEAHVRLGILYELQENYQQALQTFLSGLEIKIDYANKRMLDAAVNLKTQLSMLYCQMGWPVRGEEIADQAVNESHLIDRQSARVQAFTALALAQYHGGKYKKSIQSAKTVRQNAIKLQLDWWIFVLDMILARNFLATGQLDKSWAHIQFALGLKNTTPMRFIYAHHHAIIGDFYRLLDDYKSAEAQYRFGMGTTPNDYQSLENQYMLGLTLCENNRPAEGLEQLNHAIVSSTERGLESIGLLGRYMYLIWSKAEKTDEDRETLKAAIKTAKDRGFGSNWLYGIMFLGLDEEKRGNIEKARDLYNEVASAARLMNNCWYELWALRALVHTTGLSNNEMRQYLDQIRFILDEMGKGAQKRPAAAWFRRFRKSLEQSLKN